MFVKNATDVRREWSVVVDEVIRERPQFIKRTRDYMLLSDVNFITELLSAYNFTAEKFIEADGSVTLSLNQINLVENGKTEEDTRKKLAEAILDYSEDFYRDFHLWSAAPNRQPHIPYVFKALIMADTNKIGDLITCQDGKN